jgi:hypothetical protein
MAAVNANIKHITNVEKLTQLYSSKSDAKLNDCRIWNYRPPRMCITHGSHVLIPNTGIVTYYITHDHHMAQKIRLYCI